MRRLRVRRFRIGRFVSAGLALAALGGLVVASVFVLPNVLVPTDVTNSAERLAELRNSARATLVQAAGGLLLALGAVATWRQLHIYREGQITDRYTRAVEQLGADTVDVQLGGIYALERLAHDSPSDQPTLVEVLTAFVRHRTARPHDTYEQQEDTDAATPLRLQERLPAVQAALTVLGRMPRRAHTRLDLSRLDLQGADLPEASLRDASFWRADLTDAMLIGADLSDAYLMDAQLTRASLGLADLSGAEVWGANLAHTDLESTDLTGARFSPDTRWPEGFDPRAAGATLDEPT